MSSLSAPALHGYRRHDINSEAKLHARLMREAFEQIDNIEILEEITSATHEHGIQAPQGATLHGRVLRLCCDRWWRRQIKKRVLSARENHAAQNQTVGANCSALYVSHGTANLLEQSDKAAKKRLEETEVVNTKTGDVCSLYDIAEAAKVGRIAELYTFCKGMDTYSKNRDWTWCMTTLKLPGAFHPNPKHKSKSWQYNGATFEQMHEHISNTWRLIRTQAGNRGIEMIGLRVSEQHKDGCPHWHIVAYMHPRHKRAWEQLVEQYAPGHQNDITWKRKPSEGPVANSASYLLKYIVKAVATDKNQLGRLDEGQAKDLEKHLAPRVVQKRRAHGWRAFQFFGIKSSMTSWRIMRSAKDLPLANPTAQALRAAALQGDAAQWLEILNNEHAPILRPLFEPTGEIGRYGEETIELKGTALYDADGQMLELIPRTKTLEILLTEEQQIADEQYRKWAFAVISNLARGSVGFASEDPYDEPDPPFI